MQTSSIGQLINIYAVCHNDVHLCTWNIGAGWIGEHQNHWWWWSSSKLKGMAAAAVSLNGVQILWPNQFTLEMYTFLLVINACDVLIAPASLQARRSIIWSHFNWSAVTIISGRNHIMFNLVAIALTHFEKTKRNQKNIMVSKVNRPNWSMNRNLFSISRWKLKCTHSSDRS